MKSVAALALLSVLALPVGAALAADMPTDPGVVVDKSGFNWDRAFATLYGAYVFNGNITPSYGEGLSLGVNMTSGDLLFGVTGTVGTFQGGELDGDYIVQGVGRVGFLAGDQLALYGLAGLGWETDNNAPYAATGLGAELAVTDNVSLRAQYQDNFDFDQNVWVSSASLGLSFYF